MRMELLSVNAIVGMVIEVPVAVVEGAIDRNVRGGAAFGSAIAEVFWIFWIFGCSTGYRHGASRRKNLLPVIFWPFTCR